MVLLVFLSRWRDSKGGSAKRPADGLPAPGSAADHCRAVRSASGGRRSGESHSLRQKQGAPDGTPCFFIEMQGFEGRISKASCGRLPAPGSAADHCRAVRSASGGRRSRESHSLRQKVHVSGTFFILASDEN